MAFTTNRNINVTLIKSWVTPRAANRLRDQDLRITAKRFEPWPLVRRTDDTLTFTIVFELGRLNCFVTISHAEMCGAHHENIVMPHDEKFRMPHHENIVIPLPVQELV